MIRTTALATSLLLALAAAGCTSGSPDDDLTYETGDGKADVARPYGRFEQTLAAGDAGFTMLELREDRTYSASQELVTCDPGKCTDAFEGTYKFASSHGKTYVVLYNGDDVWYSFEYKLEYKLSGEALALRYTGTDDWFTMTLAAAGLSLDDGDNGGTFQVAEGEDVVLRLSANATTGYDWVVTATDRTFGYPEEDYQVDGPATGSGGTAIFTWHTSGPLSFVGSHTVTLGYKRPWETTTPPLKTYTFTVDVTAP